MLLSSQDALSTIGIAVSLAMDLCLLQRVMTGSLLVSQNEETDNDSKPVQIVRDDRSIGRGILPSKERIENAPSSITILSRGATLIILA